MAEKARKRKPASRKASKKATGKPKPSEASAKPDPLSGETGERPLAACRRCGSTDLVVVKTVANRPLRGVLADGRKYTSVIHQRVRCRGCGQSSMLVLYPFDPKQWKGDN